LDQKLINTGFTMNKLSKNLLATLSGLALVIFPQLTIAEGEEELHLIQVEVLLEMQLPKLLSVELVLEQLLLL